MATASLESLFGQDAGWITKTAILSVVLAILGAAGPTLFLLFLSFSPSDASATSYMQMPWTDPRYIDALLNSLGVGIGMTLLLTLGSCCIALVFRRLDLTGNPFIYAVSAIPLLVPDFAFGVAGRMVLDPSVGLLGRFLPPELLIDRIWALSAVIAVATLKWLPVMTVVADASLASIPERQQDQIRIDFSSYLEAIRLVYLPSMTPQLLLIASLSFLIGFRQHELALELTSSGGGFAAELWSSWNYRVIFEFAQLNKAAIDALFVLPLLLGIILFIKAEAQKVLVGCCKSFDR
jgi:ABC-type sugar transport system permease subunit